MRLLAFIVLGVGLAGGPALAQLTTDSPVSTATNSAPALTNDAAGKAWAFSASAYGYLIPDGRDYAQPTITADRGWLHLEARYNYEAIETGSIWVGYNFSVGDKVTLDFTPMLGGVFGDLNGIAPGYAFTVSWWKLQLYSQGEYVFDTASSSGNFFYTWSELSLAPVDWFRFGLVAQRTKAYQTALDIQRGFLVGFTYKQVDFTTYVFDPGQSKPTVVLAVALTF